VVALGYRATLAQKLQYGLFVFVVVGTENAIINGGRRDFWVGPLVFTVVFTLSSFLPTRPGTEITREGVTVRTLFRRTVSWAEIESVTQERRLGGASRVVLLHEAGGRTTRLQGLSAGPLAWDPDFDAKYRTVTHWWSAGRAVSAARPSSSSAGPGRER
jgi:hypothetical protein